MTQTDFAAALLAPGAPVPGGLVDPQGRSAQRRFDIYRNNVATSLTRSLQAGFPVVEKLVGAAFFAAMAGEFARSHPPRSRILMLYGAAFPDFVAGFPPVAHLPYLPDVARLEQAIRESYHAADTQPIAREKLERTGPDALLASRIILAPSLRLVRSSWPVLAIWRANRDGGPMGFAGAQAVAVLRKDFDPSPLLLPPGGAEILTGLIAGQTLGQALDDAAGADLAGLLALLIQHNAILDLL